ncbi:MAG: hypothetical protein NC485_15005 [Ruminococcus flavefaciens]|nr:hypothetical protein [Ruminococcus flavefaciens]MCM1062667.1 hypothetical protein [Eubacterium sp.]
MKRKLFIPIEEKRFNNERKQVNMVHENGTFIIIAISADLFLGTMCFKNKTTLSRFVKRKIFKKKIKYTSKDKDMVELIHELAELYRKRDEHLKK